MALKRVLLLILLQFVTGCASSRIGPPPHPRTDPRIGSVSQRDFFLYSCMREYMKANSVQIFDGSVGYGVEYSNLSGDELNLLQKAAETFAKSIRAPDYSDREHGLPAVLVLCQKESRKYPD